MKKNPCKYIFVIGGVISGVGKGITTSSIGKILQDRGFRVTAIKIDPYVNVDAGTMNPTEHGEVFVLEDGAETDQDMGNYERFLNTTLSRINYMTTGLVYQTVIGRERNLEYGGRCVQVVPHIPFEIIRRIKEAGKKSRAEVVVIEVGGTVGEYENILFLEAARMMKIHNPKDVSFVMVSYLPTPSTVGEMKTKPTQHAVRALNSSGIQPDIIIARSDVPLDEKRKEKLSFFCNMSADRVVSAPDIKSVYDVPDNFEKENLSSRLCSILGMKCAKKVTKQGRAWKEFIQSIHRSRKEIKIAVVGKYFETGNFVLADSYLSVIEAVKYSAYFQNKKPVIEWLLANDFETSPRSKSNKAQGRLEKLKDYDGIIVPGGFGKRGIEGKLNVIKFARENKIPYFGLCYGMQLAVIEYARNILGLGDATTREIKPRGKTCVIDILDEQKEKLMMKNYGGSMRLGSYPAILKNKSIAREAYGKRKIFERHRHRYEVNIKYVQALEKGGLVFSGFSPDKKLMEIAELPKDVHPFFLATQFHPEFKAHPLAPHPLFNAFIKACCARPKFNAKKDVDKK